MFVSSYACALTWSWGHGGFRVILRHISDHSLWFRKSRGDFVSHTTPICRINSDWSALERLSLHHLTSAIVLVLLQFPARSPSAFNIGKYCPNVWHGDIAQCYGHVIKGRTTDKVFLSYLYLFSCCNFTFLRVIFSNLCCDKTVLMFWLGLGTKATWLGLPASVATNNARRVC